VQERESIDGYQWNSLRLLPEGNTSIARNSPEWKRIWNVISFSEIFSFWKAWSHSYARHSHHCAPLPLTGLLRPYRHILTACCHGISCPRIYETLVPCINSHCLEESPSNYLSLSLRSLDHLFYSHLVVEDWSDLVELDLSLFMSYYLI